jgi:hypothetical protein
MAAIIEQGELDLHECLTRISFTTDRQHDVIIEEGFSSINDLNDFALKDVADMCKKTSGLSNARGGVRVSYNLVCRLKGFVFWVKDHHRRDQHPDAADWNMEACRASMEFEEKRAKDDTKIDAPCKLKSADWQQWELKIINFLQSCKAQYKTN